MVLLLGDVFPNFSADTSAGYIEKFHDAFSSWAILFSHPADFTPVCTTELAMMVKLLPQFEKRNCKLFALSCDSKQSHVDWSMDVMAHAGQEGGKFPYAIIVDDKRVLAVQLGMVDPDEKDAGGLALTCRALFIIGPDKKLKLSILYPATTGRNFDEILRVLDSLQLTASQKVATPVNWKSGGDCMVVPSVKEEDARSLFPEMVTHHLPSKKPYLRFTPHHPASHTAAGLGEGKLISNLLLYCGSIPLRKRPGDNLLEKPGVESLKCLGYRGQNGALTHEMCLPGDGVVVSQVKQVVTERSLNVVFVATDHRDLVQQLSRAMKAVRFVRQQPAPVSAMLDLAILQQSDHFVGNCVSSFTAFVKRGRDVANRTSSYWACRPTRNVEL